VKADDVKELIGYFRNLASRGFWNDRRKYEQSGGKGPNADQVCDVCPMDIHNEMGFWAHVQTAPDWPMGLMPSQFCAMGSDWASFSELLTMIIRIAQSVLRSPDGARAYLAGAPLFFNTFGLNMPAGQGPGVTAEEFVCSRWKASHATYFTSWICMKSMFVEVMLRKSLTELPERQSRWPSCFTTR
jgi:hypothetical protein